ncbi:MAG TPA: hypothetical protein VG815_13625 [Chloroflexota bacterium]|nr:hypothetical protein [Chloroflexota bacterium]
MSGARLRQLSWLTLAVIGAGLWFVGPASQSLRIRDICRTKASCAPYQLDTAGAAALTSHGISLTAYATTTVVLLGGLSVIWYGLGGLIMWRKPWDRGAVLAAFFLVAFPLLEVTTWIPSAPPLVKNLPPAVGITVLCLFCVLFPDGRFSPRWARWLIPLMVLAGAAVVLPTILRAVVLGAVLAGVLGSQVSRFRSISSWGQRQQTKWALLGVVAAMTGFVGLALGLVVLPVQQTDHGGLFTSFANSTGLAVASSAIPITIAIAVLRYHLWDINRVISLTLVYTSLTAILGAVYVVGVVGLQRLFELFAGNGSSIAIAISTLVIAALFGPLRRRIQIGIDRRFYRAKYDAARTLAAFGDRLRHEVDLAHLCGDLTVVVHETFSPEHVTLWLNGDGS